MRFHVALLAVGLGYSSVLSAQENSLADRMFCDYVTDFGPQIVRNRIRGVPFARLDEFGYFDARQSEFLRGKALEIYALPSGSLRQSLEFVAERYVKDCRDAFPQD